MKKLLLLTLVFVWLAVPMARAQNDARKVPNAVLNAFNAKYPNMTVKDWDWEDDKDMWEAEFMMNGREYEAYFMPDGTWKKTKSELKKSQVPAAVNSALTTGDYSTWKAEDYYEMDSPETGRVYKAKVKKGDETYYLQYDASGKLVDRKSKDEKKAMKKK